MNCKTCGQEILLKVGDRVEAIGEVDGVNLKGKKGVVKYIYSGGGKPVLVEFVKPFKGGHEGGYDGMGHCNQGRGRWGEHKDFKVIKRGRVENGNRKKNRRN